MTSIKHWPLDRSMHVSSPFGLFVIDVKEAEEIAQHLEALAEKIRRSANEN